MTLLRLLEPVLPALASFGPLFLVMKAKPERAKSVQSGGVLMVSGALILLWTMNVVQRGEISLLQQRLSYLETRAH